jgi:hypothetical protein
MLSYFVAFTALGALIRFYIEKPKQSIFINSIIAILWGLSNHAIWGLVTFGELMLGYAAFEVFNKENK